MHIFKSETLYFPTLTPIIDLMLNRFTAYPQHKNSLPKAQSPAKKNIRKGLDTMAIPNIMLTAYSLQLTAYSLQLTAHSVNAI